MPVRVASVVLETAARDLHVPSHGQHNDGLWSEAGASFVFTIPPSFTQGVLFKALCAVAVFGLLWLLYTIRLRQFTAQVKARLYERLAERTRIARELHDTLLQSFQGLLLHFQRARNLLPERLAEAIQTLDTALDGAEQAIVEGRDAIPTYDPGS